MDVPRIPVRLNAMIFMKRFPTEVSEVTAEMKTTMSGVEEAMASDKFKKLLQYGLAVGNYINGSTFRGGAYGFKLEDLNKVGERIASKFFHTSFEPNLHS
jgi:hypothetical protein